MKNKLEQELKQKEFENEIERDLNLKYAEQNHHERMHAGKNKYVLSAVYFFGTLVVCYFIYIITIVIINTLFGAVLGYLGVYYSLFKIFVHAAIFILATVSAVKRKSVLDEYIDRKLR